MLTRGAFLQVRHALIPKGVAPALQSFSDTATYAHRDLPNATKLGITELSVGLF